MTIAGPHQEGFFSKKEKYIGLSTDTKPTNGVQIGAIFFETDTNNTYIFNSVTWVYTGIEGLNHA